MSYPPWADCSLNARLGSNFIELMVRNYPERPEYLALLRETDVAARTRGEGAAGDAARSELLKETPGSGLALYLRDPDLDERTAPALSLPDWCPPELRIGHIRTGVDGRESLLLVNASGWGNHHHYDSLNLYYWKNGGELLSDLGYLWDHPSKHMTMRTVAHNTVVLDEKDQVARDRGGEVLFFRTSEHVKAMEASSRAYPQAKVYRRTSAVIDHGEGRNYVVDFFRVEGGTRQDYVYHGLSDTCQVAGLELLAAPLEKAYDFSNLRAADGGCVWRATWESGGDMTCVAWNLGQPGERALVAGGWGQRDWKNSDIGATIPYIVRRCEGGGPRTFISVFEGHQRGTPFVRGAKLLDPAGALLIETALGRDYVMSMAEAGVLEVSTSGGGTRITGHFAAVSVQNEKLAWTFVEPDPTSAAATPGGEGGRGGD